MPYVVLKQFKQKVNFALFNIFQCVSIYAFVRIQFSLCIEHNFHSSFVLLPGDVSIDFVCKFSSFFSLIITSKQTFFLSFFDSFTFSVIESCTKEKVN